MRSALHGLTRFIATPYTAKFRPFVFVDAGSLPDAMAYAIACQDAFVLGALSSAAHASWALAAGGTLEDRPRYNSKATFFPFPFPAATDAQKQRIRDLGEQLDAHRKKQQAEHPTLTITGMYNVLEKLRSGELLTEKEKVIHQQGLVSVLKQIHDDLDAAVFDAYGWPATLTDDQILEKLVALNAERAEEERKGLIRWLRPEFQNPSGAKAETQVEIEADDDAEEAPKPGAAAKWPKKLSEQISAVKELVQRGSGEWSAAQVAAGFAGATVEDVEPILDSLASLGLVVAWGEGAQRQWQAAARAA